MGIVSDVIFSTEHFFVAILGWQRPGKAGICWNFQSAARFSQVILFYFHDYVYCSCTIDFSNEIVNFVCLLQEKRREGTVQRLGNQAHTNCVDGRTHVPDVREDRFRRLPGHARADASEEGSVT